MGWFRRRAKTLRPKQVAVKVRLPFLGEVSGTWEPSRVEAEAAWELYVELITRVTVVELRPDEGLLREALSSLYTLFGSTREILRRHGPELAPAHRAGEITFGALAIGVLNGALRPLLTRWHPALAAWEATRPSDVDPVRHEKNWPHREELRGELDAVRKALADLATGLAGVAGVTDLLAAGHPKTPGGGLVNGDR